ncbi:MAG: hypothetical protein HYR85_05245 [Planctomycetes bacterium]|nr:hypothetical protein [Planctomycetota bacterium]MBI3846163.1 hypothetical protein [Planctomycetota bacterium]
MRGKLKRAALGAVAILGTIAWTVAIASVMPRWRTEAAVLGVAAGIAWPVFGGVVLYVTRGRPSVVAWVDACLNTMALGIAVLLISSTFWLVFAFAGGNPMAAMMGFLPGSLLASFVVMIQFFLKQALGRGMPARTALGLWFGVLLGSFAVIVLVVECALGWQR